MNIFDLSITALLVALGLALRYDKAKWAIQIFISPSKSIEDKKDEEAISRFLGDLVFILAIITFIMTISGFAHVPYLISVLVTGWILTVVITVGAGIYLNTGNRFKHQKTDHAKQKYDKRI